VHHLLECRCQNRCGKKPLNLSCEMDFEKTIRAR
jgi:hypothetical protein